MGCKRAHRGPKGTTGLGPQARADHCPLPPPQGQHYEEEKRALSHEIVALNSHLLEAKVTIDKLSEDNVSVGSFQPFRPHGGGVATPQGGTRATWLPTGAVVQGRRSWAQPPSVDRWPHVH